MFYLWVTFSEFFVLMAILLLSYVWTKNVRNTFSAEELKNVISWRIAVFCSNFSCGINCYLGWFISDVHESIKLIANSKAMVTKDDNFILRFAALVCRT